MGSACTQQPSFSRRSETGSLPCPDHLCPTLPKVSCFVLRRCRAVLQIDCDMENAATAICTTQILHPVQLQLQSSSHSPHGGLNSSVGCWMRRSCLLRAHELLDNSQEHRSCCTRCSGYEAELPPASSWRLMKLSAVAWSRRRTLTQDHSNAHHESYTVTCFTQVAVLTSAA